MTARAINITTFLFVAALMSLFWQSDVALATPPTSITPTAGMGNLGTTVTQAGNVYNITGGTRPGGGTNLFHSFGNFSVGTGDIANFQNTLVSGSLPMTAKILARVTGGTLSSIYGTVL